MNKRKQASEWIRQFLSETDTWKLKSISIPVSSQRALNLVELLEAWRNHIVIFEEQRGMSDLDRRAWGIHDFIAALSLRSFIHCGLEKVESEILDGLTRALDNVDANFTAFTEIDRDRIICRIDERGFPVGEWWWERIPQDGPIRRDIERMRS